MLSKPGTGNRHRWKRDLSYTIPAIRQPKSLPGQLSLFPITQQVAAGKGHVVPTVIVPANENHCRGDQTNVHPNK